MLSSEAVDSSAKQEYSRRFLELVRMAFEVIAQTLGPILPVQLVPQLCDHGQAAHLLNGMRLFFPDF